VKEDQARSIMVEYCRSMYAKGFFPGIDGNISMRVDGGKVLITPTGVSKSIVSEEQLSLMTLSGEHVSGEKPSS
jgi:ribulose-5-phosphate 4-epimerase/fuculose-1-phosphate aldolase